MSVDLFTLLEVRDPIETAIQDVLETATGGDVLRTQDTADRAAPFVTIDFDKGSATGHRHICPDGVIRDDCWQGSLTVQVCTARAEDGSRTAHNLLRGKVLSALTPGMGLFTTDNLPYHQLVDCRLTDAAFQTDAETGLDVTELRFDTFACIRPDAWRLAFFSATADSEQSTADDTEHTADAA